MADQRTEPKIVYHYTSMSVLLEIIKHKQLWATNIHYLNDSQERYHFMRLVMKRIEALTKDLIDPKAISDLRTELNFRKRPDNVPFVVSFSEDADSLSQWQSYCHAGNGVAIGFRTDELKRANVANPPTLELQGESVVAPPSVTFKKVRYFGENDIAQVDELIMAAVMEAEYLDRFARGRNANLAFPLKDWLSQTLEATACVCKNPSFGHEREWRLIVAPMQGTDEVVHYRASRFSLLPYVPVTIPIPFGANSVRSPIDPFRLLSAHYVARVIVGPTPNALQSVEALKAMFHSRREDVEVARSAVPFRDWL